MFSLLFISVAPVSVHAAFDKVSVEYYISEGML